MTPPIDVPWPPMNLVAECTTMSAPCSNGRQRYGVAKVESTTNGRSWAWATSASAARSATAPDGFPMTSVYRNRVSSSIEAAKASGASPSTKRASMPRRPSVVSNMVWVPP